MSINEFLTKQEQPQTHLIEYISTKSSYNEYYIPHHLECYSLSSGIWY